MKTVFTTMLAIFFAMSLDAQINPTSSPYYLDGTYTVVMDSISTTTPDLLIFRPNSTVGGPYPTILFQPGANSGTAYITKHSYDIYWEHLASYGYVIIIMNNTSGGPNATLFTTTHDYIKNEVASGSGWMSQYIDLNRFIAAGHSNGGMNATDIIINRPSEIQAIIYMASYPNPGIFGIGSQNVTNYDGKVLILLGDEDETSVPLAGSTNDVATTAYDDKFTSVSCKTRVLFEGIGHGGFGDYNNPAQPVGTIGREPTTASIRHFLVSFLNSQFKADNLAWLAFSTSTLQPNSVGEYNNTCSQMVSSSSIEMNNINIYPNPTSDYLFIENINEPSQIIVSDISGRILINNHILSNDVISTQDFKNGIYFIEISNSKGIIKRTIIKE